MASRWDFTIDQGVSWEFPITLKDSLDLTPIGLSGYSGRGQIRRSRRSPDVVAELTVTIDPDQVTINGKGKLSLSLTAEQTSNIPAGETVTDPSSKYVYDFEIFTEDDPPIVKRILEGFFYINPEVTKG